MPIVIETTPNMQSEFNPLERHTACIFSDDFTRVLQELQRWIETRNGTRFVSLELDPIPDIGSLNQSILAHLAKALQMLWPDWYQGKYDLSRSAEFVPHSNRLCQDIPHINRKWLDAAATLSQRNELPLMKGMTATTQVRQQRLALSEQQLLVGLFIEDSAPSSDRLLGLARSAEWLAREAEASVLLVLPPSLRNRAELDTINSDSQIWSFESHTEVEEISTLQSDQAKPLPLNEQKHLVCPIIGRPHSGSPGEQRLAQHLLTEEDLCDLFQFNQRVTTALDSRFIVDLLWPAGRIVVEIDGYGWHSSRSAFNADRERDYELTISHYLVLRLPHDFVVQDPMLACERIREVVNFRRQHPLQQEITQ